jgi:ABC-2 type transport system permease protein
MATCIMGVIKAAVPGALLALLASGIYSFDLLSIGPALAPFLASLLLFGWAMGMVTAALILRFGQAAEALVWGVPFLVQPFSAVFYPVSVLPGWLQGVARLLPSTHVFEGLREALRTGSVDPKLLATAFALNVLYLAAAALFFAWMLERVRERGYLARLGME